MADTSWTTWAIGNIGPKPVDKNRVWEVEWKATGVEKECGEEGTSVHQKLYSSLEMKISLSTLDYSTFVTIDIGNTSWLFKKVFSVREYVLYDLHVKLKHTFRESAASLPESYGQRSPVCTPVSLPELHCPSFFSHQGVCLGCLQVDLVFGPGDWNWASQPGCIPKETSAP